MESDQFYEKFLLNQANIEEYAPESPGVIILYNELGNIIKLKCAENNIKSTLSQFLDNSQSHYFSFRHVKFITWDS